MPASFHAMMISSRTKSLFSTHPPLEARIAALEKYAGAAEMGQLPRNSAAAEPHWLERRARMPSQLSATAYSTLIPPCSHGSRLGAASHHRQ